MMDKAEDKRKEDLEAYEAWYDRQPSFEDVLGYQEQPIAPHPTPIRRGEKMMSEIECEALERQFELLKAAYEAEKRLGVLERQQRDEALALLREARKHVWCFAGPREAVKDRELLARIDAALYPASDTNPARPA